jgi:hypothetical protein
VQIPSSAAVAAPAASAAAPLSSTPQAFQAGAAPVVPSWEAGLDQQETPWDPAAKRKREPYRSEGMAAWMKLLIVFIIVGVIGGAVVLLLSFQSRGPDAGAAEQLAKAPRDAMGFGTARVSDLWDGKPFEKVRGAFGAKADAALTEFVGLRVGDIERLTLIFGDEGRGARMPDAWVMVHTKVPLDKDKFLKHIAPRPREAKAGGKTYYTAEDDDEGAVYFASDKEVWVGTSRSIVGLLDGSRKVADTGPLNDVLSLASEGKHGLVVGFQMPARLRDEMRRAAGFLPPGSIDVLELTSATLTLRSDGTGEAECRVTYPSNAAAKKAEAGIRGLIEMFRADLGGKGGMPRGEDAIFVGLASQLLRDLKIETRGNEVVLTAPAAGEALASVFPEAISMMIEDMRKGAEPIGAPDVGGPIGAKAGNNMRALTLAMHAYHDDMKHFPPARLNKGLSWRVALLPYLEQKPLYDQFKLDEPWDSEHNSKLLDRMPIVFAPVDGPPAKPGLTCYQVVTGEGLVFDSEKDIKKRMTSITDGTSNTIMIVEASRLVPWTAPEDVRYQPDPFGKKAGPRPELGYQVPGRFLVGMCDGSIRWLPRGLDQFTLDCLIHPADGNVIPDLPEGDFRGP